jgi:predicted transcriptional regulator
VDLATLDIISDKLPVIKKDSSLEEINNLLTYYNSDTCVICDDDKYIGQIKINDLINTDLVSLFEDESKINSNLFVAKESDIFRVADIFINSDADNLPVVDDQMRYMGSINKDSFVKIFGNSLAAKIPGSLIVLDIFSEDYSLTEISTIIESENAKITGLFINNRNTFDNIFEVSIKLNLTNIDRILASFERYNYKIKYYSSIESIASEKIMENYNALIHYLNV